jgi:hypothetical protein
MRANETRGQQTGDETMTTLREACIRHNRLRKIVAAGMKAPYLIDYTSCPGFWFIHIDGRSYPIGHDGTEDADMARKAMAWVAKQVS